MGTRSGWHIECSAMAMEYLGTVLDIHGGGQELIFPHHENEIAQTESYTGVQPMARFWMHNGLMRLGDEKMSKSLGNLVTVRDALERYSSDSLRLFFLGSHYRSPTMYTDDGVESQERAMDRLRGAVVPTDVVPGSEILDPSSFKIRFIEAMDDDLNTPRALAAIFELIREINRGREDGMNVTSAQEVLIEVTSVLGLTLDTKHRTGDIDPLIDLLIKSREELRSAKMYAQADGIRERLDELGYVLEDSTDGTTWKRKV